MNAILSYRKLSKDRKAELLQVMIDMRRAGRPLMEIGAAAGVSKYWACQLMKRAGIELPEVIIDKRGSPRTKHGRRKAPEYYSWYSMKTRCGNPNHGDYQFWGGKGITYDPRWECFLEFYRDMGPRPTDGKYTLERLDGSKGYCKDNCVWLLKRLQNRNLSTTVLDADQVVAIRKKHADGARQCDLAREYGIKPSHVGSVVKRKCWKDI